MTRIEAFAEQAGSYLPGFLFSFNIADFKRRNGHLSHEKGDLDLKELDGLLGALGSEIGLVERIHGQRWFMVSQRQDAKDRVQALLDGYKRTDRISTGWTIWASEAQGQGESMSKTRIVQADLSRAVRCLYAAVRTPEDVRTSIGEIAATDYNLPVNQPIHLAEIPALTRKEWCCVSRYPAEDPSCPFCNSRDFDCEGCDGAIYSSYGKCRGCGAEISISMVDRQGP